MVERIDGHDWLMKRVAPTNDDAMGCRSLVSQGKEQSRELPVGNS